VKASPDGLTLLVAGQPETAMLKALKASPPYDFMSDLVPLAILMDYPFVLVVAPTLGVKTWDDLVAFAESKPGGATYGTAGIGTTAHLMIEQLAAETGLKAKHIPYKGAATLKPDLVSGRIDFTIDALPLIMPFIGDGRVIPLAVTLGERDERLPDVPSIGELKLLEGDYTGWTAVFAPQGTPETIRTRIHELAMKSIEGDARKRISAANYRPGDPKQADLTAFMQSEQDRWLAIVKRIGLAPS
jgi:tripartite-type tricarboxylate transporter receptor subunit TctC